jgi:hypothetical protein
MDNPFLVTFLCFFPLPVIKRFYSAHGIDYTPRNRSSLMYLTRFDQISMISHPIIQLLAIFISNLLLEIFRKKKETNLFFFASKNQIEH